MIRIEACQHCYRDIRPAVIGPDGDVELWEDPNGITVCKKKADGEQFLHHKPMPGGGPEPDDRCISCGAEVDHYLGCPDDPNPDYEAEAEVRDV